MSAKSNITRAYWVLVLVAAALAFGDAVSAATKTNMVITDSAATRHALRAHPEDAQAKRHLTTDDDDDVSEARTIDLRIPGLDIPDVAKLKDLAKSGTQKLVATAQKLADGAKLQLDSANQNAAAKLFTLLKVDTAGPKPFESKQFQKWALAVAKVNKKNPELAMIPTLTTRYGDDGLAKLIAAAKDSYKTRDIARNLKNAQLAEWLGNGKTADDVFKLLKLDDQGSKLFKSPALVTWVAHVITLDKGNPFNSMLLTLSTRYDSTELGSMLIAAKEGYTSQIVAEKLEKAQLMIWRSDGKTAADMFQLLKLNEAGGNLFRNPMFGKWVSYEKILDKDNAYDSIYSTLMTRYGDEALTKMVAEGKNAYRTQAIAAALEKVQLTTWLVTGKTADDVFKLLKLDEQRGKLFENPIFETWTSYVKVVDKENPYESMLVILKTRYDDEALATMVAEASRVGSTKTFVSNLQEEIWLSEGKTSDDVFKLLKLNEDGTHCLRTQRQ